MGTIPCSMFYVILVLKTHPPTPLVSFLLFVAHFYIISLMILDMLHSRVFCFCFDMQISLSDIERHL